MQARDGVCHELGNLLGIVLANLEGMIDGIVPPTNERLEALAESVRRSRDLLRKLDSTARER